MGVRLSPVTSFEAWREQWAVDERFIGRFVRVHDRPGEQVLPEYLLDAVGRIVGNGVPGTVEVVVRIGGEWIENAPLALVPEQLELLPLAGASEQVSLAEALARPRAWRAPPSR